MSKTPGLLILGGGVAGLGLGFYGQRSGLPFRIIEAGPQVGGNARTLTSGPFRFDTGAHRFHDRYPDVTADIRQLLGADLAQVDAPSQIFWNDSFVDFPLTPINLVRSLGLSRSVRAALDVVTSRLGGRPASPDFESGAVHNYGRTIAELFLLGYTEKLWGVPASRLSPSVSGRRLQGLSARMLAKELLGLTKRSHHLEGRFYYPTFGIGMVADKLAEACGPDRISLGARVTRIQHRDGRLVSVQVNGREEIDVEAMRVVSTLAPGLVVELLSPAPPDAVLALARSLRFRNVVLVTLFIDRPSVTPNATIYFPDATCPFTRASEPRNRSRFMSPEGKTSLSIEIPCWSTDQVWRESDDALVSSCMETLHASGVVRSSEVMGGAVHRLGFAYPVLELGADAKAAEVHAYLGGFSNLSIAGRSGAFAYVHLHDLLRSAREIITELRDAL